MTEHRASPLKGSPSDPVAPLLDIQDLSLEFSTQQGPARVLEQVSLRVRPGEIMGLVGETGCGKSVLAKSIPRLLPEPPARITQGRIMFAGQDLARLNLNELRRIRGRQISMIFQEPMTSLNPVFTIGNQMREVVRLHLGFGRQEAESHCRRMLAQVGLADPARILRSHAHALSGGQRQRVMIATALSCDPLMLIADEPTTALDVTVQAQVLRIIQEQAAQRNMAVLLITHDMGVVAQVCDRVAVMYAGMLAEVARVEDVFTHPRHPYTQGLIAAIPGRERAQRLRSIAGVVPGLVRPPTGCRFHPRCALRDPQCVREMPVPRELGREHGVACWAVDE